METDCMILIAVIVALVVIAVAAWYYWAHHHAKQKCTADADCKMPNTNCGTDGYCHPKPKNHMY